MKRIISLAVAGALLLGTVCTAGAFEVKPKSQWDFSFGWVENTNYTAKGSPFLDSGNGGPGRDNFEARQRVRVGADLIVSEQLSGTVYFEIGDMLWGNGGPGAPAFGGVPGGAQGGDGINVETKHAYLDWMIPGTQAKVRMGLQTLGLPHFTSANPVFNHDVTAAVISAPITDQFGITAFWARPFDVNGSNDGVGNNFNDEIDMFGIILPVTLEGMKISPYAVYASIGGQPVAGNMAGVAVNGNPNTSTNGWVAGLAYQLTMFDPLTFAFNFVYSQVNGEGRNNVDIPEISGWFFDAALTYKLDFGTAGSLAADMIFREHLGGSSSRKPRKAR